MTSNRFNKAYNALVNAFFNGTLAKGACTACAIGNIVADAMGTIVDKHFECKENNTFWSKIFTSSFMGQKRNFGWYPSAEARLKYLTEYDHMELAQVEEAFEKNTKIMYFDYYYFLEQQVLEDQYNGLCAAVDVLLSFEENTTNSIPYKEKFREHPKLVSL